MTLCAPSSNATIASGTGTVTIGANNGSTVTNPGISAPSNVVAGAADGYVDLPVTLSAPGINPVTVNYATANGSGISNTFSAGSNIYQGQGTNTLTFLPGVTTQVVRVPLLNCPQTQNLTFTLNLSGASHGTITDATTTVTVGDFPTITTFTPATGPVGTKVKITGSNLGNATSVKFNGKAAAIKRDSANKLKVVVPAGATTGPITITTPCGIGDERRELHGELTAGAVWSGPPDPDPGSGGLLRVPRNRARVQRSPVEDPISMRPVQSRLKGG